ncbi:MAG: hypothetical protein IPL10_03275 [Bacteroidetes bacterium]|nr:hypothetical protein [Bacteroidota bacterium]
MKAFFIITLVFLLRINLCAQESNQKFIELKQVINTINSEVDFNDKLVFISVWKSTDAESREINKEAYRVYKIYERAKLKNGEKGTVFISLNLDSDEQNRVFAIGKDGLDASIVYSDSQTIDFLHSQFNLSNPQNTIVFDKTGTVQYTNLPKDQIFNSLRNLITR